MRILNLILFSIILTVSVGSQETFAQQIDWNLGDGLKQGDYFKYSVCNVDYKDCTNFEMEFWIQGIKQVASEKRWVAQTIVHDGNKVVNGEMELGKIIPEPMGSSTELRVYTEVFKSSISWISAFSNAYHDSKWAIGSGIEIRSDKTETVYTKAGIFESHVIYWNSNNQTSKIWVVDNFPFPVKADTWIPFSEGEPIQEFRFELLDYQQNVKEFPLVESWQYFQWEGKQFAYSIPYQITNGIIENSSIEGDDYTLVFNIKANQYSSFTIKTPHHNNPDRIWKGLDFLAFLDGTEIKPKLFDEQEFAQFTIILPTGTRQIELVPMSSVSSMPVGRPLSELLFYPSEFSTLLSPKDQFENEVPPLEIICQENLNLIFKASDNSPACVKPDSIPKLIERGWAKDG